jgi:hypothetical protein
MREMMKIFMKGIQDCKVKAPTLQSTRETVVIKIQMEMEGMVLLHHPHLHLLLFSSTSSRPLPNSPKGHGKTPSQILMLKLDIKFELPMYNGEVNAKKLDNWIRQIEVYCMIQKIQDDETKIQLASLRLDSVALIWWESKTQEDMKKHGKILTSWNDFIFAIKRQFYPLAYMQKATMDWQNFRQAKG